MINNTIKRIYLYGVIKSDNIGDNVICDTFCRIIEHYNPDAKIHFRHIQYSPIIFRLANLILKNKLSLINRLEELFLFRKYKHGTCIIFAGGQMFYEYFVPYLMKILRAADKKSIPVYFYGCGTGIMRDNTKGLLSDYLSLEIVKKISVRDNYINIKVDNKVVELVPDVATCCSRFFPNIQHRKDSIGLGVISIDNYNKQNVVQISRNEYYLLLFKIIEFYNYKGFNVELFCNGNIDDYKTMNDFYETYKYKLKLFTIAQKPKTTEDLLNIISAYCLVIASRLHAMIIAYSYDIPFWGLSWDRKIKDFCNTIGHPNRFCDLADAVESISLKDIDLELTKGYDEKRRAEIQDVVFKQIKTIVE